MSDDEAALRAAIVANPDDDAPRLVLADLLTSRGDPHGELIVLMCGPKTPKTEKRIEAMLRAGWKAYAGELAPFASAGSFERGFVATVRMTIGAFAKQGDRVFSRHPVQRLEVRNARWTAAELEKLGRSPGLAKVRSLSMHSSTTAHPLAPLAASKQLCELQELSLVGCGHSPDDWKQFFERIEAPKLAAVSLLFNRTSACIQAGIARNPALASLRALYDLVSQSLDDSTNTTADAYAQLAERVELHRLAVDRHDGVGDAAIAPFFATGARAALRSLRLLDTRATDALLHAIATSPKAATLEAIELRGHFSKAAMAKLPVRVTAC